VADEIVHGDCSIDDVGLDQWAKNVVPAYRQLSHAGAQVLGNGATTMRGRYVSDPSISGRFDQICLWTREGSAASVSIDACSFHDESLGFVCRLAVDALEHRMTSELATKSDLAELRAETKAEFAAVRAEMKAEFAAVRAEIEKLRLEMRADMNALHSKILIHVGAMQVAIASILFAALKYFA
jgi:hypothetical protein